MSGVLLLTRRDLLHRKLRFLVTTLVTAVVFSLLFLMNGLVQQFNGEPFDAVEAIGGSQWVLPEGVSGPFTATATLPLATATAVAADEAEPIVVARATLQSATGDVEVVLVGAVPGALGSPAVSAGRALGGDGDAVVDEQIGATIGDTVTIGTQQYEVVGATSGTTVLAGLPLVFVEIGEAQQLVFGSSEVVSGVVAEGTITALPEGTAVRTADDVAEDALGPLENAISSIDLIRALLWLVAAIIIGSVVYLSALERTRDFAVLKAVGATNRELMAGLAIQAALVALVAVAGAAILQAIIGPLFPMTVRVTGRDYVQIPVIAVIVALAAAAVGIRKVRTADPAAAFGGSAA